MISAKWVYSWKVNELGHVVLAKARLVTRGFAQREGIDFFETFSPYPSVASVRLLAAIACEFGWDLCHFDAEQAFTQSKLDEVVFIRLPAMPSKRLFIRSWMRLCSSVFPLIAVSSPGRLSS